MGFDLRRMQLNGITSGLRKACCAQYAFNANQTNAGLTNIPGGAGGLAFASFLLGVPNTIGLRGTVIPYYYRYNAASAYLQDDWKVTPNPACVVCVAAGTARAAGDASSLRAGLVRPSLAAWTAHDVAHGPQISRVMAKRFRAETGPWAQYLSVMRD